MIVSPATISIPEATSPIASLQGRSHRAYRTTFTGAGIHSRYLGWVSAVPAAFVAEGDPVGDPGGAGSPIRNAYYSGRLLLTAARRTSDSVAGLGAEHAGLRPDLKSSLRCLGVLTRSLRTFLNVSETSSSRSTISAERAPGAPGRVRGGPAAHPATTASCLFQSAVRVAVGRIVRPTSRRISGGSARPRPPCILDCSPP